MNNAWTQILAKMQENLTEADYFVWIRPLKGEVRKQDTSVLLSVTARNSYVAQFVRSEYTGLFAKMCALVLDLSDSITVDVEILVDSNCKEKEIKPISALELAKSLESAPAVLGTTRQLALPIKTPKPAPFVFKYSFDDFVVGPSNRLAFAAAESLLQEHAPTNMIFLSSQSGLGKTHLIQSLGKTLSTKAKQENLQIAYLSAEQFTTQFVRAAQTQQMAEFKNSFRSLDVLLLEDVHQLQGKEKTQEELLATIKTLHSNGGRVVLTSSFTPKEIVGIDTSLLSHFHTGFIANIEKPDMETRFNILLDKARKASFFLPSHIAELMASRITGDVRILESCLNNLRLHAQFLNAPVSDDMALEIIGQVVATSPELDLKSIVRLVCKAYGITEKQLQSSARNASLVLARNTAFYLLRKHTDMTLNQIGTGFHRRHSTVSKGITMLEKEMSRESSVGRQVAHTIEQIERQSC